MKDVVTTIDSGILRWGGSNTSMEVSRITIQIHRASVTKMMIQIKDIRTKSHVKSIKKSATSGESYLIATQARCILQNDYIAIDSQNNEYLSQYYDIKQLK